MMRVVGLVVSALAAAGYDHPAKTVQWDPDLDGDPFFMSGVEVGWQPEVGPTVNSVAYRPAGLVELPHGGLRVERALGDPCPTCGKRRSRLRPEQELDLKLATRLEIRVSSCRRLAEALYGRSAHEERTERAGGDRRRGALGHITRELATEMESLRGEAA